MANSSTQAKPAQPKQPAKQEPTYYAPAADVVEKSEGYIVYLDVPGAKAGEVDITYDDDILTVEAPIQARQPDDQQYVVREYGIGPFRRSFRIASPINPDGIRAELKNGELILTVPKAESAKTRKIQVKTA